MVVRRPLSYRIVSCSSSFFILKILCETKNAEKWERMIDLIDRRMVGCSTFWRYCYVRVQRV